MIRFQAEDPTLESQWRAIILFGKNSATYKFAFAKALLEVVDKERTSVSLEELAHPFSRNMLAHLKTSARQGTSNSSTFLNGLRDYLGERITYEEMIAMTVREGFKKVVDAFQNVHGERIPNPFYEKDYSRGKKEIVVTDALLSLKESFHFGNLGPEVEARWDLVETAWNLQLNPKVLQVQYDELHSLFYLEDDLMRRTDVTSVRNSLNGYQKGKCFYSFRDISVIEGSAYLCEVDHFFPHANKRRHIEVGANVDGVWNLVLADGGINREKSNRIPDPKYLSRLYTRNEFFISSRHPLGETIANQTGHTPRQRQAFLQKQMDIAAYGVGAKWCPSEELDKAF